MAMKQNIRVKRAARFCVFDEKCIHGRMAWVPEGEVIRTTRSKAERYSKRGDAEVTKEPVTLEVGDDYECTLSDADRKRAELAEMNELRRGVGLPELAAEVDENEALRFDMGLRAINPRYKTDTPEQEMAARKASAYERYLMGRNHEILSR